ncbi:uncharacterized protein CEXT_786781 [Caerostris extrusa]|uniref:Uncharacterized protein n=1 Tax=Caerostris extrusa TaxID=172846 RepID=A0AAV4M9I4_CAEEX|nr:uncharacterized protein CEXT_786781 [Caerostris extrusa]
MRSRRGSFDAYNGNGKDNSYKSPMSKSFVQHHNLKGVKSGGMVFDEIITHESHVADVYDQNMEVSSQIRLVKITKEVIPDPGRQHNYEDLNDWRKDVNEEANELLRSSLHEPLVENCESLTSPTLQISQHKRSRRFSQNFLGRDHSNHKKGGTEGEGTKSIGEKLVRLQKAARILKHEDLKHIKTPLSATSQSQGHR